MKKKTKIWFGVGAFVVAGGSSVISAPATIDAERLLEKADVAHPSETAIPARESWIRIAQGAGGEKGGEAGGEGGGEAGGEAGINVAAAENDPVEYGIALAVIAAHYHAGLAAYEAGKQDEGAQMFAHGLSEVYVEMEPVFKKRGVTTLGDKLQKAVDIAAEKAPAAKVRKAAQDVLAALDAAGKKAPRSKASAQAVKTQVVAEMIERSAAQYAVAMKDNNLEPYLDGYGFSVAARRDGPAAVKWLRGKDKRKGEALDKGLKLSTQAYSTIERPAQPRVPVGDLLGAGSAAKFATANLQ